MAKRSKKKRLVHYFRKRAYVVQFSTAEEMGSNEVRGLCDPPSVSDPVIDILENQSEQSLLDTCIHEALHACDFSKTERTVYATAESIASLLWKLGYRRVAIR